MSRRRRAATQVVAWGIGLFVTLLLGWRLLRYVHRLPAFIDETIAVEAAANFLHSGDYTSALTPARFDPWASSGFLATWPGGLGWLLTGRIAGARLAAGLVTWVEGMVLAWLFFRSRIRKAGQVFLAASAVCLLATFLPLGVSFLWNLGEIPGAIWIGLGLCAIARHPLLAFFCFGLAVWQGKFLYLIAAACLAAGWWIATRRNREGRAPWPMAAGAFFLPLLLWMAIIWMKYDAATVVNWVERFAAFIRSGRSGLEAGQGDAVWADRLARHWQLWKDFPWRTQLVVTFLIAGPAVLLAWLRARTPHLRKVRLEPMLLLATVVAILIYAGWFFLLDPYLWLRHLLPALCLGFGALVYMSPAVWRLLVRS